MVQLLHCDQVTAKDAQPARWLWILHGLMGSRRNWLGIARRVVEARPTWGVSLLDLPWHGDSTQLPGPFTVDQAARYIREQMKDAAQSADAVLGHSFGGKVALKLAEDVSSLQIVFLADASPSAAQTKGRAWQMIQWMEQKPGGYASREEGIHEMTDAGISSGLANWMAMNLVRDGDRYRWRLDPATMRTLYEDFQIHDLWNVLSDRPNTEFVFLCARHDSVLADKDRQKLADSGSNVSTRAISAGHWLHVDDPDAVSDAIVSSLLD